MRAILLNRARFFSTSRITRYLETLTRMWGTWPGEPSHISTGLRVTFKSPCAWSPVDRLSADGFRTGLGARLALSRALTRPPYPLVSQYRCPRWHDGYYPSRGRARGAERHRPVQLNSPARLAHLLVLKCIELVIIMNRVHSESIIGGATRWEVLLQKQR